MKSKVGIINAGIGNINSISNALKYIGYDSKIIQLSESKGESFSHIFLPGVGSFETGSKLLNDDWREFIYSHINSGNYILGICLGMQLLFNSSEESPGDGLKLINGTINKLPEKKNILAIPRIGWRLVDFGNDYRGNLGVPNQKSKYYFVHSYGFFHSEESEVSSNFIVKEIQDNIDVVASIEKENIFGVQYHPEKSSIYGLEILSNFLRLEP